MLLFPDFFFFSFVQIQWKNVKTGKKQAEWHVAPWTESVFNVREIFEFSKQLQEQGFLLKCQEADEDFLGCTLPWLLLTSSKHLIDATEITVMGEP